jgi:mono/diheme cytochrome c family protein
MFKTGRQLAVLVVGAALAAFSGQAQMAAQAQAPFSFKSVSVDLPTGDRMFPGDAKAEAINNNCLACHSADMVLNQPALTEGSWQTEVQKMIKTYKAPVAADDVAAIVAYLGSTKGLK